MRAVDADQQPATDLMPYEVWVMDDDGSERVVGYASSRDAADLLRVAMLRLLGKQLPLFTVPRLH